MTQTVDRSVSAVADWEPVDYLARAEAVARIVEHERDATITRPVYEALAEAELFWTLVPTEFGGGGLSTVATISNTIEVLTLSVDANW